MLIRGLVFLAQPTPQLNRSRLLLGLLRMPPPVDVVSRGNDDWRDSAVARALAIELDNTEADEERLLYLASRVANNSMVGGSKFLHFYAPSRFPVTDSWLQLLSQKPCNSAYGLDYYRDYVAGIRVVDNTHTDTAMQCALASRPPATA